MCATKERPRIKNLFLFIQKFLHVFIHGSRVVHQKLGDRGSNMYINNMPKGEGIIIDYIVRVLKGKKAFSLISIFKIDFYFRSFIIWN